jgi:hypothetical protein
MIFSETGIIFADHVLKTAGKAGFQSRDSDQGAFE